jgi:hypothetical protein
LIDIFRVDEGGTIRGTFPDCEALHEVLDARPPQDSCCLRFIDPYGDTTFNQLQLPVLAAELRAAAAKSAPALRQRIETLATFVESAKEPQMYVKFVGD